MAKTNTKKRPSAQKTTATKASKKTKQTKKTSSPKKQSTSVKKNTGTALSKKKKTSSTSNTDAQLLNTIIQGMQEKKANNITVLDLQNIENSFCNYFVICEAESKPQLQAITESVEEFTQKKLSVKPHHTEGLQNAEWILMDYLTIIVHIFRSDVRHFYKIEDLWADAKIQHI